MALYAENLLEPGESDWDTRIPSESVRYIRQQTKRWTTKQLGELDRQDRTRSRKRSKTLRRMRRRRWQKIRQNPKVSLGKLLFAIRSVLTSRVGEQGARVSFWNHFCQQKWPAVWRGASTGMPLQWTMPPAREQEASSSDEDSMEIDNASEITSASSTSSGSL
jgi:hypothetical protein